jgi:hypothetical protein
LTIWKGQIAVIINIEDAIAIIQEADDQDTVPLVKIMSEGEWHRNVKLLEIG